MTDKNQVLNALLERLYAALARGPAINCSPGNSRQRIDLSLVAGLENERTASGILGDLLGPEAKCKLTPVMETLPPKPTSDESEDPEISRMRRAYDEKMRTLRRLSAIASDADTYLRDTGNYVLYIGYPILSIPQAGGKYGRGPSRILSPLAFIPVGLKVTTGRNARVHLSCAESGADRVIANAALKIWIERQLEAPYPELFEDEEGADPLREVAELTQHVCEALSISDAPDLTGWPVQKIPELTVLKGAASLVPGAVLGLFHLRNQSTIKDMEDLQAAGTLPETVAPFVTLSESLVTDEEDVYTEEAEVDRTGLLPAKDEHLVDNADPCQRRAVIRARDTRGLVVHGPPGTGKSQTITNIIGDYLGRGKRVLLVCEKRTALDVVKYRLDARGLGHLCGVVHDAQRDRTGLYKSIRDDLEGLADAPLPKDLSRELGRLNTEIDRINGELHEYYSELQIADQDSGLTLHEMVGHWFQHGCSILDVENLDQVNPELVLSRQGEIDNLYNRLRSGRFGENGWEGHCGVGLNEFLAHDMPTLRRKMKAAVEAAGNATGEELAGLPPWNTETDIIAQADLYKRTATRLRELSGSVPDAVRKTIAGFDPTKLAEVRNGLGALAPQCELLASVPLAPDLLMTYQAAPWDPPRIAAGIPALATYLVKCQGFFGMFRFGTKKAAAAVLAPLGLPLNMENAARTKAFLEGVMARNQLRMFIQQHLGDICGALHADAEIKAAVKNLDDFSGFLYSIDMDTPGLSRTVREASTNASGMTTLADQLERAAAAASAIQRCLQALTETALLTDEALLSFKRKVFAGRPIDADIQKLTEDLEYLEPLLRFETEAAEFPAAVGDALKAASREMMEPDTARHALLSSVYFRASQKLLREHPQLQAIDTERLEGNFKRLRELTWQKQELEVGEIQRYWMTKQKERLLASTGTRLNSMGADMRRRLTLRGRNASRLREVIHGGQEVEGGDPLFDMRPVWMTSPETACMIFPATDLFDAVIFDEASQCRLEEGLPVLTRGRSVIIAGDTKQLPPTSFFQSSVVSSTETMDADDSDESLFQSQQAEIEDLLTAALNIEIDQSYLDVHYRSTSPDLIDFSNASFYGSRLQAIPGHPNNVRFDPAIQLHKVDGVLEDRMNEPEADYVVRLVKGLLRRDDPPSIGIVTFNLPQKDLIDEKLNNEADEDPEFRRALDAARERQGRGSFEGLFVKNLENVQGDERDYIIISTTFAPNKEGRFYRRFGPLGRAGGERRLNVIVTRARYEVDLVTSIPSSIYREDAATEVPAGKRPNGAFFLMRYLAFAEELQELHEARVNAEANDADTPPEEKPEHVPSIVEWQNHAPSTLVRSVAERLADGEGMSSMLYYANDGFAVDLALKDPADQDKVTLGVLFDETRYRRAQDKVEWDGFRRWILDGLGWELQTVWTPHLLRDPDGMLRRIVDSAQELAEEGEEEDVSGNGK